MDTFLDAILAMPTGIFTVLMGLVLLYWLFFMFGAFDLDLLGGADGAAEGALEGAAEGALEGAAEGALEGAGGAAGEGALEGGLGGLLGALRLRSVPVTIALSFITFFGWLASYFLRGALDDALPGGLMEAVVFVGAGIIGIAGASVAVRPFGRLFVDHPAAGNDGLIGTIVVVTTGRVDETFGQAQCTTRDSLLLNVRAPGGAGLKRGDKAIIVDHDPATHTFTIEPADPVLLGIDQLDRS